MQCQWLWLPFCSKGEAFLLILLAYARASSVFLFLPSLLHLLGVNRWARVSCGWRLHPFPFTCFFAMDVVQGVEFQIVVVMVKVKAGFAFTLNRLIYRLLRVEVKGEGKNGKFAESASAYIRVGACPARRVKGILCGVGRFEMKQGRKSRKVEKFWEKVGLYFLSGVGEGEKNNFSCLLVLGLFRVVRLLFNFVLWLFRDGLLLFVLGFLISAPLSPFWYCSVCG